MKGYLTLTPEDCAVLLESAGSIPADRMDKRNELWLSIRECAALVPPPLNGDKVWGGSPIWNRPDLRRWRSFSCNGSVSFSAKEYFGAGRKVCRKGDGSAKLP